tara:strand:+ start:434 stop:592 length:159 start_codon:yes stop_codon:yes gene_type:complete
MDQSLIKAKPRTACQQQFTTEYDPQLDKRFCLARLQSELIAAAEKVIAGVAS